MVLVFVPVLRQFRAVVVPVKAGTNLIAAVFQIRIAGQVIAAAVFDGAYPLDLGLDGIHNPHIQNPPDQRGLPVHRRQNTLQRLVGWYLVAAFLSAQPHNGIGEQRIIAGYLKFHNIWILRFQNYTS